MIDEETKRIIHVTNCNYLEDLGVHITQSKYTSVRDQKKIDIDIPNKFFIHRVYMNSLEKFIKMFIFLKRYTHYNIKHERM